MSNNVQLRRATAEALVLAVLAVLLVFSGVCGLLLCLALNWCTWPGLTTAVLWVASGVFVVGCVARMVWVHRNDREEEHTRRR